MNDDKRLKSKEIEIFGKKKLDVSQRPTTTSILQASNLDWM